MTRNHFPISQPSESFEFEPMHQNGLTSIEIPEVASEYSQPMASRQQHVSIIYLELSDMPSIYSRRPYFHQLSILY